jgi:hypothetical protein
MELAPQAHFREDPVEPKREESESESESLKQLVDQQIRDSPIMIPRPLHPTSAQIKPVTMATKTVHITRTAAQPGEEGPSTIGTAISMATAQQIHSSLQQSMHQAGPPRGGRGGGTSAKRSFS